MIVNNSSSLLNINILIYYFLNRLPRENIHDVLLHFSSAKLPFNTYDKMLPKLLGFLDEWNPVDLIPRYCLVGYEILGLIVETANYLQML